MENWDLDWYDEDEEDEEYYEDPRQFLFPAAPPAAPPGMWRPRQGESIPVRSMTAEHLGNAIQWVQKNIPRFSRLPKYRMLLRERRRRVRLGFEKECQNAKSTRS